MTDATTHEYILEVKRVSRLFGSNKSAALKLLGKGRSKLEIQAQTGVSVALHDVSFKVPTGGIFAVIGLSGSGKSTIIRCMNLLQKPTSGQILFRGQNIALFSKKEVLGYRRRNISMVFQHFGLMDHRNVLENVAYGLEVSGVDKSTREAKAMEMIAMVGLEGWGEYPVSSLSGGMQQRVGLARALATEPDVLLMDEPFSALDPLVRRDMQFELLSIQRNLGMTIIFITHDINEAFKLGDTVAIMREGQVEQIDTPEQMSLHPANDYVRKFIKSADRSQVLTARHIMATPSCVVRVQDGLHHAIHEMQANGLSSVYIVGEKMRLKGIVTIDNAIEALRERTSLASIVITDLPTTTVDTHISDILPLAVQARFPLAVVDADNRLKGIVTKSAVLSSLCSVDENTTE